MVVLAGGVRERVTFSPELERGVWRTMAEMRRILASGEPPAPRWVAAKCSWCGHRQTCWDADDSSTGVLPIATTG